MLYKYIIYTYTYTYMHIYIHIHKTMHAIIRKNIKNERKILLGLHSMRYICVEIWIYKNIKGNMLKRLLISAVPLCSLSPAASQAPLSPTLYDRRHRPTHWTGRRQRISMGMKHPHGGGADLNNSAVFQVNRSYCLCCHHNSDSLWAAYGTWESQIYF